MRRKDLKRSDTSKNLPKNLDFGEKLEDKNGEKISGGAIFRFVNNTPDPIDVTLSVTVPEFTESLTIRPFNLYGTETVSMPGDEITIESSAAGIPIISSDDSSLNSSLTMEFTQIGVFYRDNNTSVIKFAVENEASAIGSYL